MCPRSSRNVSYLTSEQKGEKKREKHQNKKKKGMENMDSVRVKGGNDIEGIETRICTMLLCIDILPME